MEYLSAMLVLFLATPPIAVVQPSGNRTEVKLTDGEQRAGGLTWNSL